MQIYLTFEEEGAFREITLELVHYSHSIQCMHREGTHDAILVVEPIAAIRAISTQLVLDGHGTLAAVSLDTDVVASYLQALSIGYHP